MLMSTRRLRPASESGSVSVEAAIVIALILLPLLAATLFLGRYFWYYKVAQKAAHDAALYMASAPLSEVKGTGAIGLATYIMDRELSDVDPTTTAQSSVVCGYRVPANSSNILWIGCTSTSTPARVQGVSRSEISTK